VSIPRSRRHLHSFIDTMRWHLLKGELGPDEAALRALVPVGRFLT
jgi:hypothetical protein